MADLGKNVARPKQNTRVRHYMHISDSCCVTTTHPGAPPFQMKRSTVVGGDGNGVVDNIRTSYGMFIRWGAGELFGTFQDLNKKSLCGGSGGAYRGWEA